MKLIKTKNKKLNSAKYNYGLGFLKVILAFDIIRSHNFNYNSTKNKILLYIFNRNRKIHVPAFCIMSFYFMHYKLLSSNIKLFLQRIERLLIPYILWPIITFILNNYILNKFIVLDKYSLNQLKEQLLFGNSYLWFQLDLIILTCIFFL